MERKADGLTFTFSDSHRDELVTTAQSDVRNIELSRELLRFPRLSDCSVVVHGEQSNKTRMSQEPGAKWE